MKVIDFIVAEDIRVEQGNKNSVMGVLGDSMIVAIPNQVQFPVGLRLAFLVRLEWENGDPEAFQFEFKVRQKGADLATFAGAGVHSHDSAIITLPLVAPFLPIAAGDDLNFHLAMRAEKGKALLSEILRPLRVIINSGSNPSIASAASQGL